MQAGGRAPVGGTLPRANYSPSVASSSGRQDPVIEGDLSSHFEVLVQIGRGSYGAVYKARHHDTGDIVALKTIPIMDSNDMGTIQQEIQLLQECDHPNIVKYLGSWRTSEVLWIAMEYCGGGSVSDLVHASEAPLSEDAISYIASEALKGLAYLHAMGKLHRDIKCGNILLTESGEVKLADFGVAAQLTSTLSKRNTFIGTPHWMAPEVIQESRYDGKVDVWALGISAIEMAEVTPPRWNVHPMRVIFMISREPPPSLSQYDKWSLTFHDFVAQCLQKDPKARPTTKHLLQHKFILRSPGNVQSAVLVPLINVVKQMVAARAMTEGAGTLVLDQALQAARKLSPAKGPWARTTAGWGRLAGLTFGGKEQPVSTQPHAPGAAAVPTGTLKAPRVGSVAPAAAGAAGATLASGTVRLRSRDDDDGTMRVQADEEEDGYGGTVAAAAVLPPDDNSDYSAALRAIGSSEGAAADDGYAAAIRSVAGETSGLPQPQRGRHRRTASQSGVLHYDSVDASAQRMERLRSLYMGENVIPLPFMRAATATALVLKPHRPPGAPASNGGGEWLQALVDVALESYSGAPSNKPTASNAVPPEALQQVQSSPVLLNLVKMLAYQKRVLAEEVLEPAAVQRVQGDINDMTDTLRTILCL